MRWGKQLVKFGFFEISGNISPQLRTAPSDTYSYIFLKSWACNAARKCSNLLCSRSATRSVTLHVTRRCSYACHVSTGDIILKFSSRWTSVVSSTSLSLYCQGKCASEQFEQKYDDSKQVWAFWRRYKSVDLVRLSSP